MLSDHGSRPAARSGHGPDAFSKTFIVLAAALPVVGSGIRTVRSANEFARNTSRYRAKAVALGRLQEIFAKEGEAGARLRQMWYCEQILEDEHLEWCRLMLEAEWFG